MKLLTYGGNWWTFWEIRKKIIYCSRFVKYWCLFTGSFGFPIYLYIDLYNFLSTIYKLFIIIYNSFLHTLAKIKLSIYLYWLVKSYKLLFAIHNLVKSSNNFLFLYIIHYYMVNIFYLCMVTMCNLLICIVIVITGGMAKNAMAVPRAYRPLT